MVENDQNGINGRNDLKEIVHLMKSKLNKKQRTIHLGIDFVNNGKPVGVSSKRPKKLVKFKAGSLRRTVTVGTTPRHSINTTVGTPATRETSQEEPQATSGDTAYSKGSHGTKTSLQTSLHCHFHLHSRA